MIKKSGADYAYIFTSFGPLAAFVRLWIECIIVRPCTAAIQSLSFSLYILKPFFPECDPPTEATRLLAAVCICFLGFVNCYSVKMSNMVQDYLTYAKVFALILICCTGFVQLGSGNTEHFTWDGTETDPSVIALSFYSGLFAYTGWNYLNFIIEEMKVRAWCEVHTSILIIISLSEPCQRSTTGNIHILCYLPSHLCPHHSGISHNSQGTVQNLSKQNTLC